jgi:hypothetical protein
LKIRTLKAGNQIEGRCYIILGRKIKSCELGAIYSESPPIADSDSNDLGTWGTAATILVIYGVILTNSQLVGVVTTHEGELRPVPCRNVSSFVSCETLQHFEAESSLHAI